MISFNSMHACGACGSAMESRRWQPDGTIGATYLMKSLAKLLLAFNPATLRQIQNQDIMQSQPLTPASAVSAHRLQPQMLITKPTPLPFTRRAVLSIATSALLGLMQQPSSSASTISPPSSSTGITRLPAPERLIAIGDLHGDCKTFLRVLRLAGLYDAALGKWTGGKSVLVQVGDVLDRGDEELELLQLLRDLKKQAAAQGGAVVTLLGNHEVLNAAGISIYASPASRDSFPSRDSAFLAGGPLAAELASWPVACVVGDTAFCHAGLTAAQVAAGLDKGNLIASEWLLGSSKSPTIPPEFLLPASPLSPRSPLWTRDLSDPPMAQPSTAACSELQECLRILGAKRLVVGHTVQPEISCGCDCSVYRVDVGLSSAMRSPARSGVIQCLEILLDGNVKVLTESSTA